MAYIQNFGQWVTLLLKSCNKHIRLILTSVLSGGQASCRLERTDPVCWWKKLICEFTSYFSIHSERQVHSWNFDIRTPISSTKSLRVLERKELIDSRSPSVHFFSVQPVPRTWSEPKWLALVQCDQLCSYCSEGVCRPSDREQSLFPFLLLHCHVNTLCTSGQSRISAQPLMFQNRCINFAWGT